MTQFLVKNQSRRMVPGEDGYKSSDGELHITSPFHNEMEACCDLTLHEIIVAINDPLAACTMMILSIC